MAAQDGADHSHRVDLLEGLPHVAGPEIEDLVRRRVAVEVASGEGAATGAAWAVWGAGEVVVMTLSSGAAQAA